MSQYKLTYFDFSGSRGEECRLALCLAGPFEDVRIEFKQWADMKSTTPYGALPVLEVEGKGRLAQTNAILRYVGQTNDLHPSDPWEAARHEAILESVEDVRFALGPSGRIEDEEAKKRARQEFASGFLKNWSANAEREVRGPFVAGDRIQVADVKLFIIMNSFKSGVIDHVPTDCFKEFPKLEALFAAVAANPKIRAWRDQFTQA